MLIFFEKSDIVKIKKHTRKLETEYNLLRHCVELIENENLELILKDIFYILEDADAKRAVNLDNLFDIE